MYFQMKDQEANFKQKVIQNVYKTFVSVLTQL